VSESLLGCAEKNKRQEKKMKRLISEKVVPFLKVDTIIKLTLKKQYPTKRFESVRFQLWQEGNGRYQEMYGIEK